MTAPADPDLRKVLPAETRQTEFEPRLNRIEIYPTEWTLDKAGETQQVVVMAVRDDGTTQDVTQYARYTSNDDQVGEVDDDGLITAVKAGETTIMVRYLGGVGTVSLKVPRPPIAATEYANFKSNNYIDELVLTKLKEVRIPPSDLAGDSEFMRRAFIDTIGLIPSPEEAKAFLDDKSPNKREKLVDSLLARPEFVDYWTLKFSDLFRNNQQNKQDKGLQVYYRWIKDRVASNTPWDQLAREMMTASGSGFNVGPANWYSIGDLGADYPLFVASATSQVFLGVRIDCARCHNHPFESWSQMDYYGFAAFFARTKVKNGPGEQERIFYAASDGEVMHPRKTTLVVQPKLLGADVVTFAPDEDRRERLAAWITSPANPWFKRSIANRLWNNYFGRGLVHPVDDYRQTNPAANEKLLDVMGEKMVAYKFDIRALMKDILNSRTYQTTTVPKKENTDDRLYASHSLPRKLMAEVLLDAVDAATGNNAYYGQGAARAV
ncbi:MAG: Ig-like protein, partial [Armatimonadetes bacterium]|nr:Ig-like protein [Armatimonadota bacterium]